MVDVKVVAALGSVESLTVVVDVFGRDRTVRRQMSKPARAGTELQAVVAHSITVARLENSGMHGS